MCVLWIPYYGFCSIVFNALKHKIFSHFRIVEKPWIGCFVIIQQGVDIFIGYSILKLLYRWNVFFSSFCASPVWKLWKIKTIPKVEIELLLLLFIFSVISSQSPISQLLNCLTWIFLKYMILFIETSTSMYKWFQWKWWANFCSFCSSSGYFFLPWRISEATTSYLLLNSYFLIFEVWSPNIHFSYPTATIGNSKKNVQIISKMFASNGIWLVWFTQIIFQKAESQVNQYKSAKTENPKPMILPMEYTRFNYSNLKMWPNLILFLMQR